MGERELAPVKAVKAVAAACPEAIKTMVEPVDEAMRVNTPGGVFTVRWNQRGSATALAQLAREHRLPIIGPHPGDQFWADGLAQQAQMFDFEPAEPFEPTRWLADGDTAQVGRCMLAVRHCPGHTPGHVVFHSAEARRAFVGDVLFAAASAAPISPAATTTR